MNTPSQESTITNAIKSIESLDPEKVKEGIDFLMNLPLSYRPEVHQLRQGLTSESSDVKIACALSIGRLGRSTNWAVEDLKGLLTNKEEGYMVRAAAAHALGTLQTISAANCLAGIIKSHIASDADTTFPLREVFQSFSNLGGLAIKDRALLIEAAEKYEASGNEGHKYSATSAYEKLLEALKDDFYEFRKSSDNNIVYDTLTSEIFRSNQEKVFGDNKLLFDGYVSYEKESRIDTSGLSREEIKHIPSLFFAVPSLHGRLLILENMRTGAVSALSFMDEYSSMSIIQRVENVTLSIAKKLNRTLDSIDFYTVAYGLSRDRVFGSIARVILRLDSDGTPTDASWDHQPEDDFFTVRKHVVLNPLEFEGLREFTAALRADQIIKQQYESERYHSPEGRVNYDDMISDFGASVREAIAGRRPKTTLKQEYSDSLDEKLHTDYDLPYQVLEILRESMLFGVTHIPETYFGENQDKIDFPEGANKERTNFSLDLLGKGLIVLRSVDVKSGTFEIVTNVPRTVHGGSANYEWGYGGSGPYELALNVLNSFIPPGADGHSEHEMSKTYWNPHLRTFCSEIAAKLVRDFHFEFTSRLPRNGGFISSERIRDWILSKI